jgi:hypothetical protein
MRGLNAPSKSTVDEVEDLGSDISDSTRLSKKQAMALVARTHLNWKDKYIADVLDVKPGSASSYVSTCRSKFDSVDEEISELEGRINEWERTEQLRDIVVDCRDFDELREKVESEIVQEEDVKYAVSYVDDSGEEDLRLTEESPQDLEVEVLEYKRVGSVEEVFE